MDFGARGHFYETLYVVCFKILKLITPTVCITNSYHLYSESVKCGDLDAYEDAEMKSEVLQDMNEFQFASVQIR